MSFSRRLLPPWSCQPQLELGNKDKGDDDLEYTTNTSEGHEEPILPIPSSYSTKLEAAEKAAESEAVTENMDPLLPQPSSKRPAVSPSPPPPSKKLHTKKSLSIIPSYLSTTDPPTDWLDRRIHKTDMTLQGTSRTIRLTPCTGDIFNAPPATLLIHACNTQGYWGAGIALAFRTKYPEAFNIYRNYCVRRHNSHSDPVPTGSALLIRPVDGSGHWIGCLFTSANVGRRRDPEDMIVQNTVLALGGLLQLVQEVEQRIHGAFGSQASSGSVGDVRMCRINSGKFGVPWEKTREAVEAKLALPGWRQDIEVWEQ